MFICSLIKDYNIRERELCQENYSLMENFIGRLKFLVDQHAKGKPTIFAKDAGISGGTFHAYMNGRLPQSEQLIRIHEYCGANINWLLTGIGSPYLNNDNASDVLDIQNLKIILSFNDKEAALDINQNLKSIEDISPKKFYEIGGYVKGTLNSLKSAADKNEKNELG